MTPTLIIIVLVVGLLLLTLEIVALPGGFAGICGFLLTVFGVWQSYLWLGMTGGTIVLGCCVAICIVSLQAERGADVRERFCQLPAPARLAICLALAGLAFYSLDATIMGGGGFLYANF